MRTLATLLLSAFAALAHAQGSETTTSNDSGTFVLHRFTTGELSTKAWMDRDGRWGRSWAYDRRGRVIYQQQTRRVGGHATVDFRYHPNGGVSRADYSTMPDGGIQWYRSTTTFDEEGRQTGFSEDGWDNDGPIGPRVAVPTTPARRPQEQVVEQRLFANEYFVVNASRSPVRVAIRPKERSPIASDVDATMLHGDTVRGGQFSMGELWVDPLTRVAVNVRAARGRRKLGVVRTDTVVVNEEHRRYYFILGRIGR
ncbi:MAG: hypothetical protein IT228_00160 [Flavobacteriales bacterium]|nr:hypothetical protein [Flavobacteriales bacterium]NUQ16479.1 hypothetical protein [Flavobacteriales bacterium]